MIPLMEFSRELFRFWTTQPLRLTGNRSKLRAKGTQLKFFGGDLSADYVVESSGVFTTLDKAAGHKK
ncbi:hypothetical protein Droror1_Dr00019919, partial [Drosera rotundifolia]